MRLLHIGFGLRGLRGGGLFEYTEGLMRRQAELGLAVGYFFAGRHYPFPRRPWLRRWRWDSIQMFEVVNSPILHRGEWGSPDPALDLSEPRLEAFFRRVLACFRPDAVHIHELAALPSSLIDILRDAGIPTLMTLQDYFPLCPTLKLLDHSQAICLRREVGEICVRCCRGSGAAAHTPIIPSLRFELVRFKDALPPAIGSLLTKPGLAFWNWFSGRLRQRPARAVAAAPVPGALYQRRRDTNLARLNQVDLLVAMSHRVEEIYRLLGVQDHRIRTLHLTVGHLNSIRPRLFPSPPEPLCFGTLNGCISAPKGAHVILGALRILKEMGLAGRFRLLIWGGLLPAIRDELLSFPGVQARGWYNPSQLNAMLDEVHVGLIPSVWEEAYGYVGVEFLAKGVPIIGNAMGGIVDYTIDGLTGWRNHSNSAQGLAAIMADILRNPEQVVALNRGIVASRERFIKSMPHHCQEMIDLYQGLIRAGTRPASPQVS